MMITGREQLGGYINGRWTYTAEEVDVINPATGIAFAKVCTQQMSHVEEALESSGAAFPKWRALPAVDRGRFLHRIADELVLHKDEISRLITLENGKPLRQSAGEVAMAEHHLRWFAEESRRSYGRAMPSEHAGKRHLVIKTPVGPVGAISPWNFPLVLAIRKVAPALAAGCTVILKPAMQTPLCAIAFARCVEAAGLPPGIFQLLLGDAAMIADAFLTSPLCRKITFTGSTKVGQDLIRGAARMVKPLSLELGGHAPLLVFEDADLDVAVKQTMIAKFRNTGQSCIAANRIFVQKTIYKEFTDRLLAAVLALKTGPGINEGVDVGPLIHERALQGALHQIDDALYHGGRVLAGGKRVKELPGYFLEPTVIEGMSGRALCMNEETFAPIAPVVSFETEEEAIARANNSPYGLSAYAMTRDLARTFRLAEQIESGTLGINDGAPTTSQCPFGGVKMSGWGRELGSEGLDEFLETKHISIGSSFQL